MNIKFTISYDGSDFFGSQKQPNKKTVEDELLVVFKKLNIDTKIIFSGRTDKNVHATGQVFNCIIPTFWSDLERLKKVLNHHLNPSIKIYHLCKVSDDFHSRFYAKKRVYRYLLSTKEPTPFNQKYITYVKQLDEQKLKEAIKEFVGVYDFQYFHKLGSDKENTIREIYNTSFYKYKDIYVLKFTANSYLRSQIRLMVNFLLYISEDKLNISNLKEQLSLKNRFLNKPAPANGLYLAKIIY